MQTLVYIYLIIAVLFAMLCVFLEWLSSGSPISNYDADYEEKESSLAACFVLVLFWPIWISAAFISAIYHQFKKEKGGWK